MTTQTADRHSTARPATMKGRRGSVTQGFLYAPFGEIIDEYTGIVTYSALPKYAFNAKELDEETGMYYYEARYYAPPVFVSRDPLFEQKPWLTPYHYCSNNPVGRVDPTGMFDDDYFNKDGKYLGSDDAQTDNVRIISQSDWDANKTVDANGNATIDHTVGNKHSQRFSDASSEMTETAQLSVYKYYNFTGLQLFSAVNANDKDGGLAFAPMQIVNAENGCARWGGSIDVYLENNAAGLKVCDHANEIVNMFSHENQHYIDFLKVGYDEFVKESNNGKFEESAINAQMQHSSWENTRPEYKQGVLWYRLLQCGY